MENKEDFGTMVGGSVSRRKVTASSISGSHYYAQCESCDFDASIGERGETREQVRRKIRKHVRGTGHRVTLESNKVTRYDWIPD